MNKKFQPWREASRVEIDYQGLRPTRMWIDDQEVTPEGHPIIEGRCMPETVPSPPLPTAVEITLEGALRYIAARYPPPIWPMLNPGRYEDD